MSQSPPELIHLQHCEVHLRERRVVKDGEAVRLSPKEADLLAHLASRAGEIVTREELFTAVWGYSPNAVSRAVDATLLRLRKKIERDPSEPVHLFSLYGQGYRFVLPQVTEKAPPLDLLHNLSDMPTPTPPSAPNRRFGKTGSKQIGGAITGEMLGRTEELNHLIQLFKDGTRIVTLTGPGGMGKTRLSQEVGRHFLNTQDVEGGVWFVDLAIAHDANDIFHAVSDTLEIPLQESPDPLRTSRRLGRAMTSRRRFLLILDNFEQLVEQAETTLGVWTELAKDALFLVTSREALKLEHETVIDLNPLSLADAVALFTERAKAVKPSFSLTDVQRPLVEDIVSQLDRIPLAIRLAAGRSRLMSVHQIQNRLSDRFKLLRQGPNATSDRQSTMEAAIDWSWNLLTADERSVLQQCAVFRSGFTLEAAEAVVEIASVEDGDALRELLDALSSKSLLFAEKTAHDSARMNTYDSVRYYALERLESEGDVTTAQQRHTAYFLTLGLELLEAMKTPQAHEAFRILKLEVDNFRVVFSRTVETHLKQALDAFKICETLFSTLDWHQSILEMTQQLLERETQLNETQLLSVQSNRANALHGLERIDEARDVLEWVRKQLDPQRHRDRWVRACVHDSILLARQRKYDEAGAQLDALLADPENQAPALQADIKAGMGFVCRGQQKFDETIALWEEAIDLGRGVLRQFWIEQTESNLAAMRVQLGELEAGRRLFTANLARLRGLAYPQDIGLQLYNLAHVELLEGRLNDAALHAQEAAALVKNGTTPVYKAVTSVQLGTIHFLMGHPEAALTLIQDAKAHVANAGQIKWVAHVDSLHAALLIYGGERAAARALWDNARGRLLELYPLFEHEIDALWDLHVAVAQDATAAQAEVKAFVSQPGVRIPRALGDFVPDPKRRGNPDHQLHILMLELKTGLIG